MMKGENVITISGESKIFTYHISNLIGKFHQLIPKKIIDVESNKILEGKKINSYIFVFLPNMFPIALTTEAFERKFHGNFQKFDDGKIYTSNIIYTEDQFLERLDTNSKNFPRIDSNPYETFIYEYDQYSHLIKINCIPTHNYKLLFGNITWKQECDSLIVTMM